MESWLKENLIWGVPIAVAIWWFVPKWQRSKLPSNTGAVEKATLEDEQRKTITTALGGAFLLISAVIAFAQLEQTRQSSTAQVVEMARGADLQYQSQMLTKAFELLGKDTVVEHLGGIRLLQAWAARSPAGEDRNQVLLDAMVGFIRDNTQFLIDKEECPGFVRPRSAAIGRDVQVALDILIKASQMQPIEVDFRGLNLSRADLSGANLRGSSLAFADLSEANLGGTNLEDSDLYCANLYKADLSGADLSGSGHGKHRNVTNMIGTILMKATLLRTMIRDVDLADANLNESSIIGADLSGSRLENANMFRTRISGTKVDGSTDFTKACLVETEIPPAALEIVKGASTAVRAASGNLLTPGSRCTR